MERLVNASLPLGLGALLWLMCMAICVGGQGNLAISIDCGSEKNYTDNSTGIRWSTDAGFIRTGQNADGITVRTELVNSRQAETLRFFPEPISRHCYVLPVQPMYTYLLRVTFFPGNWRFPTAYSRFEVYLNATPWIAPAYSTANDSTGWDVNASRHFESIFFSPGSQFSLCLVPLQGIAFISALEVRQLGPNMYSIATGSLQYLRFWRRINAGVDPGSPSIRYPDDEFDRLWLPLTDKGDPCPNVTTVHGNLNASNVVQEMPPSKVMEDASICTESPSLQFRHETPSTPVGGIVTYAYFQELGGNASTSNVRAMDYYVNNIHIKQFNTSQEATEVSTPVLQISDNYYNMSFRQALGSLLPPMINALEIYFVYNLNSSAIDINEGKLISSIQSSFNLMDWIGDPCVPRPFSWLQCKDETKTSYSRNPGEDTKILSVTTWRVTKLNLADTSRMSSLPQEVAGLEFLTDLNLSNIHLNKFPLGFSRIVNLTTLDLSNNKFNGSVELFVNSIDFNNVQQLYAANNLLEGSFSIDELLIRLPQLKMADFDRNKNIGGTLNLSSWHASLYSRANGQKGVLTESVDPLISLRYNKIDDIFPGEDVLSSTIETILDSSNRSALTNGILLGGNPWCDSEKSKNPSLAREYLCRFDRRHVLTRRKKSDSSGKRTAIIMGCTFGICALIICVVSLLFLRKLRYQSAALRETQEALAKRKVQPPFYSYGELRTATHDFSSENHLGKGGFGTVYKGTLADASLIAVKQLFGTKKQTLSEFLNETMLITGIKHRHLIQLKGCCIKEDQRILVYDYAENGNLAEALWGSSHQKKETRLVLDWERRLNICVGIARGLAYLHEELQPRIIHRDIKPANILIDASFNAKIADFGLARPFQENESHAQFTNVAGTLGYLAPEYITEGKLSEKADVYSFGVVVLEIISGRKCIDHQQDIDKVSLLKWVRRLRRKNILLDILDPSIRATANQDEVKRVIDVAYACLNVNPVQRPTMSTAMVLMQGVGHTALDLESDSYSFQRNQSLRHFSQRGSRRFVSSLAKSINGESGGSDVSSKIKVNVLKSGTQSQVFPR